MSTSPPIAVISPHGLPRRSGVPSVKALSVSLEMVGRIGIEPMTNGLKVF